MRRTTARSRRLIQRKKRRKVAGVIGAAVTVLLTVLFTTTALAVFWFHLAIRPVLSGSMRPTFGPGWAIVTKPIPLSEVHVGQILVFEPPGANVEYSHRVVSVSGPKDHPVIITKGDANHAADTWHAQLNGTSVSEVVAEYPGVGWLMVDVRNQWAHAGLVALVGVGFCIIGTRAILGGSRTTRRVVRLPAHAQLGR